MLRVVSHCGSSFRVILDQVLDYLFSPLLIFLDNPCWPGRLEVGVWNTAHWYFLFFLFLNWNCFEVWVFSLFYLCRGYGLGVGRERESKQKRERRRRHRRRREEGKDMCRFMGKQWPRQHCVWLLGSLMYIFNNSIVLVIL